MIAFWSLIVTALKVLFSDSVFNLSKKVLPKTKVKVQEKGFGFFPTQRFINEADLQRNFDDFAKKL